MKHLDWVSFDCDDGAASPLSGPTKLVKIVEESPPTSLDLNCEEATPREKWRPPSLLSSSLLSKTPTEGDESLKTDVHSVTLNLPMKWCRWRQERGTAHTVESGHSQRDRQLWRFGRAQDRHRGGRLGADAAQRDSQEAVSRPSRSGNSRQVRFLALQRWRSNRGGNKNSIEETLARDEARSGQSGPFSLSADRSHLERRPASSLNLGALCSAFSPCPCYPPSLCFVIFIFFALAAYVALFCRRGKAGRFPLGRPFWYLLTRRRRARERIEFDFDPNTPSTTVSAPASRNQNFFFFPRFKVPYLVIEFLFHPFDPVPVLVLSPILPFQYNFKPTGKPCFTHCRKKTGTNPSWDTPKCFFVIELFLLGSLWHISGLLTNEGLYFSRQRPLSKLVCDIGAKKKQKQNIRPNWLPSRD